MKMRCPGSAEKSPLETFRKVGIFSDVMEIFSMYVRNATPICSSFIIKRSQTFRFNCLEHLNFFIAIFTVPSKKISIKERHKSFVNFLNFLVMKRIAFSGFSRIGG